MFFALLKCLFGFFLISILIYLEVKKIEAIITGDLEMCFFKGAILQITQPQSASQLEILMEKESQKKIFMRT